MPEGSVWDAGKRKKCKNLYLRGIRDGEVQDIEKTEDNKNTVRLFLTEVLQNHFMERFDHYVSNSLIQHDRQLEKTADDWISFITDHAVAYDSMPASTRTRRTARRRLRIRRCVWTWISEKHCGNYFRK